MVASSESEMLHILFKLLFININFKLLSLIKLSFSLPDDVRPVYPIYVRLGGAPFVVLVDSIYIKCTGTIISDLWVITTAYCVHDADYHIRENISVSIFNSLVIKKGLVEHTLF